MVVKNGFAMRREERTHYSSLFRQSKPKELSRTRGALGLSREIRSLEAFIRGHRHEGAFDCLRLGFRPKDRPWLV